MNTKIPLSKKFDQSKCTVCGQTNCNESIDHKFVSYENLKTKATNLKECAPMIDNLKYKVKNFFDCVLDSVTKRIEISHTRIQEKLNIFYYSSSNVPISIIEIFCQVLENDTKSLPSKKLKKIHSIENSLEKELKVDSNNSTKKYEEEIKKFSEEVEKFYSNNILEQFLQKIEQISNVFTHNKNQRNNISIIENDIEQVDEDNDFFQWKYLRIRNGVKNISLNCKKIKDTEIFENFEKLKNFTSISEFEARGNLLTHLSSSSFVFYLPQIKILDLRSNKLNNKAIEKMKGLQNLKQFMISENFLSDPSCQYFKEGFPALQVLWIDNNRITELGIRKLIEKEELKVCSALENCINTEQIDSLKKVFARKGILYL